MTAPYPQPKSPNMETAISLASAGIPVFPVGDNKHPLIKWRDESTCDIKSVIALWNQHQNALVGIDCGKAGLVVIDADRHGGPDGVLALEELLGEPATVQGCPVTSTAGNGLHLFFKQPDGEPLGNGRGSLPAEIDVRGNGGFVIAPGSMRDGGTRWAALPGTPDLAGAFEADTIPVLPKKLAVLIRARREHAVEPATEGRAYAPLAQGDVGRRERAFAQAALERNAAELASCGRGGRNELLNKIAFRMGRMSTVEWVDAPAIRAALWSACESNFYIKDKGRAAFEASFKSGMSAGGQSPHQPLEDSRKDDQAELRALGNQIAANLEANDNFSPTDGASNDPLAGFIFDGDASLEPSPMLIKKLVPLGGICFIGGQSGAGKTFIAVDLSVSLASGEPFFDQKVTERVGVAIFAAEGSSTIASRVAVARDNKASGEVLPIAWLGLVPNLADPKEVRAIVQRLRAVDDRFQASHGVRLGAVIFDTLAASFNLDDENNNSEAAKAIRAMKTVSDALGVVAIPVHHYGKAAETGLRGASAWRAGCDAVLSILADRDQTTGQCNNRRIALTKSRVGEEGWNTSFDLRFVVLGEDEDGELFGACYVEPGEAEDAIILTKKAKPLPRAAKAYMGAFHVVFGDKGQKVRPFGSEGPEVVAVDREVIRQEFNPSWPADSDTEEKKNDARRKAFERGERDALDRVLIATREVNGRQLIWLVAKEVQ